MKSFFILLSTIVFCSLIQSCTRSSNGPDATRISTPNTAITHTSARIGSASYSQPIPLDTATKMIASYLLSINYPTYDTNVRSLSLIADSVRAYLSDSRITTFNLRFAHNLSWINGGSDRLVKALV